MRCDACFNWVTRRISSAFKRYGNCVGRNPLPFIIIPIIVLGSLGAGLIALEQQSDLEKLYFPKNSRAIKDRQFIRDTFPNVNNVSYNSFSQSDQDNALIFIFKTKGGKSIFDAEVTSDISAVLSGVESLSISGETYSDLCAKSSGSCVVDGRVALDSDFQSAVEARTVSYPFWNGTFLDLFLSGVTLENGKLVSTTVLKVSFQLAREAQDWKRNILKYGEQLDPTTVEVAYEIPESLSEELDKSTRGDVVFFSLTIAVMCTYASIVSAGGNVVSTRSMLAFAGILAAGLGIIGSFGLLSALGVEYSNIVGVIPFLIIGIGVDDMFLLMSSWSGNLPNDADHQTVDKVPTILGQTLASAGIGITITSITDFLAFVIGTTSVFSSVTIFSLYAGVAVLFCYVANVTFFTGCLAFHGRRVYSSRHFLTCRKLKPRQELRDDNRSACYAYFCGGSPPRKERDDESACEKFPGNILPRLFERKPVSIVIIFLFMGYLAAAIYGVIYLKQGLVLQNLVLDESYYYKFLTLNDEYFISRPPIGFYVNGNIDYIGKDGLLYENLLQEARKDDGITSSFERCWFTAFKSTQLFNLATSDSFISNLQKFLDSRPDFRADIVLDSSNTSITASRCFVFSKGSNDNYDNADLMARMRSLADDSPLPTFAYHWTFVPFEQFLAVLPATLQLLGIAIAVMTVVTFLFLPHPLMVLLVLLTIVMILVGIFGFLHFWDLTLSSITMIHLVMSVGFSVDFSAHVCSAYLLSTAFSRQDRARYAIRHAAGPILNGATSTLLGVMMLLASSSYIFQSFFKVMVLVIGFGMLHAVFFLPAVLSLLGPESDPPSHEERASNNSTHVANGTVTTYTNEVTDEL